MSGNGGVVKDPGVHRDVLTRTLQLSRTAGFVPRGLDHSPVTGGEGNIEYLLFAEKRAEDAPEGAVRPDGARDELDADVAHVVAAAHEALGRRAGTRMAGR